ncbi:SMI1/KNR4 family protein [Nocardia sp. NPDC052112]|uniref:SMI1/KNR4 family protein n=1 Tax=Nocardia sp. NPDC052112 TaxID=3155646 RepID=UPI0034272DF1
MTIRDFVDQAVAIGATLGAPASEAELAAAEARLGVRFDAQYRELMSIGSGIEGLGSWFLYPVSELGVSKRWQETEAFLVGEYFVPADEPFRNGDRVGQPRSGVRPGPRNAACEVPAARRSASVAAGSSSVTAVGLPPRPSRRTHASTTVTSGQDIGPPLTLNEPATANGVPPIAGPGRNGRPNASRNVPSCLSRCRPAPDSR